MDYLDKVLIKLKRKYSVDEVVAALTKKLSEAEVRNGVLVDENQELKTQIRQFNTGELKKKWLKEDNREIKKEIKEGKIYQTMRENINDLKRELARCRDDRNKLIAQLLKKDLTGSELTERK